jgi:protein ImuB
MVNQFSLRICMFACIYIPDFPVAAIVRAESLLRDRAVAVLEGKPPQTRVVALNEKARLLGMEIGMTKLQAAIFAVPEEAGTGLVQPAPNKKSPRIKLSSRRTKAQPKLLAALLRQRSPAQEKSSHAALLDVAHAFTPRVEDTHPDRLLLDLDGLERLYGPAATMARELASRVSSVGLDCNIGMATNPDTAMHAACGFSGITVIPTGEEARWLGILPLPVLLDSFDIACSGQAETPAAVCEHEKLREQMLDTLGRWGVPDFRTLALLPEHALAARLGEAGTRLQRLARGAAMRTLALCEPPVHFEEAMELESAVETLEPLSFLLNRLLEQLCARLEARALAVQELQLRLQLEPRVADEQTITLQELAAAQRTSLSPDRSNGDLYTRTLRLPVAMRDPRVFLKLLQLDLAAHSPEAPVCKLWISAEPARPRSAQHGLFLPITPEAEKLEITLARITGVVGERRAGIARLMDTHRPDAFRMERFVSQPEPGNGDSGLTLSDNVDVPPLALRVFRPPRQVRVQLAEGRPCRLAALTRDADRDELQGNISWSAGPWRSSGGWWAEQSAQKNAGEDAQAWNREEWDIALANGDGSSVALYRIYRDAGTGQWFADASYD